MSIPTELIDNVAAIFGGDRTRAQELVAKSLVMDHQALQERRDSKTQTPPAPQAGAPAQPNPTIPAAPAAPAAPTSQPDDLAAKVAGLDTRITQAVEAMNRAAQTMTESGQKFEQRIAAVEAAMKGIESESKARQELAPRGSQNPAQSVAGKRITKWLTDQEGEARKTAEGQNLSIVELALGQKVVDETPTSIQSLTNLDQEV